MKLARLIVVGIILAAALAIGGCLGVVTEDTIAAFTYSSDGLLVSFSASSSIGTISEYTWWFGDGLSGTGLTVNHLYAKTGVYEVRLIVVSDQGVRDEIKQNVTISTTNPIVCLPDAVIKYSPRSGIQTDSIVTFRGTNSIGGNNSPIDTGYWTFGDGKTETGPWVGPYPTNVPYVSVVTHTYKKSGNYFVTLTIVDRYGNTDTDSVWIEVE